MMKFHRYILLGLLAFAGTLTAAPELPVFGRSIKASQVIPVHTPNSGFEGSGGWEGSAGAFIPSKDAHYGKVSCRLPGGFIKSNLIGVNVGDEVCFEAWTKVDNLKTVCAELQFFGEGGAWLRRGSGQLARGDQYSWQKISGSFVITDTNVKAVTLQFYGQGNVDDVKVWRLVPPPDNGDAAKAAKDIALPRKSDADFIYLANEAYEAWISRKSGMMVKLVSLLPTPKVIQPAGQNSMQLYLLSRDGKVDGDFDKALSMEQSDDSTVTVKLTSSNPLVAELAAAVVKYELKPEILVVSAELECLKNDERGFQCGLRNVFQPTEWNRHIMMTFPVSVMRTDAKVRGMFYYGVDDDSSATINSHSPFAVLQGSDRWLLWGTRDYGRFTMFTPNDIAGRLPSQTQNPTRLTKGKKICFESVYRVHDLENHDFSHVLYNHYGDIYSSNHLMQGLLKRHEWRDFTKGAFAWYHPGSVPLGQDGWRSEMLKRHANNVWYSWWSHWTEENRTEGEWYTYDCRPLSAKGLKEEIDYMKKMDLNVYLYFRQFLVEDGTYENKAPYKKWLGRDAEGNRIPFIDLKVPKPELLGGIDTIRWTAADFGNRDFRKWYIERVKKAVDFYKPTGICWDMGFNSGYSAADPEGGIGNGTLRVQAIIYDWLKENYPDMRIATNESFVSPTAFLGDSILIEGAWEVARKDPWSYYAAAAHNSTVFSLQLADDYAIQGAPEVHLTPYDRFRCKVRGVNLKEVYLVEGNLLDGGFKADGTWQTIEMPLKNRKRFRQLEPGIRADGKGNGWLEIAELTFLGKNGASLNFMNRNSCADDFFAYGKWNHRGPSTGRFVQTADGIRIEVDMPNGSYGGRYVASVREKLIYYHLKVTGLGAVCSDAHLTALEELNAFGSRIAAMNRINSQKVIYGAPENLYGTVWDHKGRFAVTSFNDTGSRMNLSLRLKRSAFSDNGEALLNGKPDISVVNPSGRFSKAADITITGDADWLYVTGPLDKGSLLIIEKQ